MRSNLNIFLYNLFFTKDQQIECTISTLWIYCSNILDILFQHYLQNVELVYFKCVELDFNKCGNWYFIMLNILGLLLSDVHKHLTMDRVYLMFMMRTSCWTSAARGAINTPLWVYDTFIFVEVARTKRNKWPALVGCFGPGTGPLMDYRYPS